jgi:hypothetical protein
METQEEKREDNIIPQGKLRAKRQRYPITFVTVVFLLVLVFFAVQCIILLRHHSVSAYNVGMPGSDNVAGMKLTIQSKDYFISGVIDTPKNKEEKYCAGDAPRIYISYEGAAGLGLASALSEAPPPEEGMTPEFSDITLYEVISPDSVETYSLNTLKKYFGDGDPERLLIVDNTHRFAPSRLAGMFRKRWKNSVINSKLSLPWWENASRIAEYKLAPVYFFRRLLFIPPVLTVLWLLYLAWLFVSRNKGRFISAVIDKIYQINYKRHMKKKQKEVE